MSVHFKHMQVEQKRPQLLICSAMREPLACRTFDPGLFLEKVDGTGETNTKMKQILFLDHPERLKPVMLRPVSRMSILGDLTSQGWSLACFFGRPFCNFKKGVIRTLEVAPKLAESS